jgi:hypothetical protein
MVPVFWGMSGWNKANSILVVSSRMYEENNGLDGFSALHVGWRIVGLRSSGKGANRTILDCLFGPHQPKKPVFCRRGGSRAPAAYPVDAWGVFRGRFHRLRA